jgi:hypothetical protein
MGGAGRCSSSGEEGFDNQVRYSDVYETVCRTITNPDVLIHTYQYISRPAVKPAKSG